jgi:hypothetical protein
MIKMILQGRKYSDTYLATICRHHWNAQMTMKKNIKWSFQPAQWLSSAEEEALLYSMAQQPLKSSDCLRMRVYLSNSILATVIFY